MAEERGAWSEWQLMNMRVQLHITFFIWIGLEMVSSSNGTSESFANDSISSQVTNDQRLV